MSLAAGILIAYIILCIVGLHVAINLLCTAYSERKQITLTEVGLAFLCVFLNILVILYYYNKDKAEAKKSKQRLKNYEEQVIEYKRTISTFIPYFDTKNHTVAALLNSGNPYSYLLGKHLLDNCNKATSYTLTDKDIYDNANVVLLASPVEVASAKYAQQDLNKREI